MPDHSYIRSYKILEKSHLDLFVLIPSCTGLCKISNFLCILYKISFVQDLSRSYRIYIFNLLVIM